MRTLTLLLCLGLLAISSAARADEKDEDECMRLHPEITSPVEVVTCTSDIEGSRKRLNAAYVVLAKKVPANALTLLEKAQRSWLAYRIAQCDYNAGGGGTGHSSDVIACTANMNRARAADLEDDLKRW
jgi:uncharacterized protein YecT (DUF1311 family)